MTLDATRHVPGGADGPGHPLPPPEPELRPARQVADDLDVDPARGLDDAAVSSRLDAWGRNELTEAPRRPAWMQFVDQFRSMLILVLVGAAVLAGVVGDVKDMVVIAVVLLLNATLGFFQERRAEASLDALRSMLSPTARVRRGGRRVDVDATGLVPGDVVLLEAGDRVPADGRLLVAERAEIDESALTGESVPVPKQVEQLEDPGDDRIEIGDRTNCAFMNTVLTRGRAEMVVTGTGMTTEIGRIAGHLHDEPPGQTPLQEELGRVGRRLVAVAAVAVVAFFALGLARGQSFGDTLLSSIALAVAAVPEGLPAVVTVTLALGVRRMAHRGAIVKRLASVETLGSTTVICSDKTGTLTLNRMTPRTVVVDGQELAVTGEGYGEGGAVEAGGVEAAELHRRLAPAVLCNDSRIDGDRLMGDPTEGALLALGRRAGIDDRALRREHPRLAEMPFDSATKLMATFHERPDGGVLVAAKGAPDVLAERCTAGTDGLGDHVDAMAARGQRVLGLATTTTTREALDAATGDLESLLVDMTLDALVGIVDPPRVEAAESIATARRAGVDIKMITGDHAATATAIAGELGIDGGTMTGRELERADDAELRERVPEVGVFARVAPEHKLRIVEGLQADGEVVAMTGDGVNDAPALRRADVGVAMGITGTEVAKEAASMVLTDDDVSTIVHAVEEGRTIFDNIVTFVRFQLSTNLGAIFSLVGAQIAGLPVPFTAIQVLWVNLIMDGPPAMTMGVDPPRRDTMDRPPRRRGASILSARRLAVMALTGTVMAAGTLGVLAWYDDPARGGRDHALAMAFTTFVMFQVFNALSVRGEHRSVFSRDSLSNPKLWMALAAVVALQVLAVHVDVVQDVFGTTDLEARDWLVVVAVASTVVWVDEIRKAILRLLRPE